MQILEKIMKMRNERNWTEYRLSEEAEIPQSTISSWYKKNMLPSITSIEKLELDYSEDMWLHQTHSP